MLWAAAFYISPQYVPFVLCRISKSSTAATPEHTVANSAGYCYFSLNMKNLLKAVGYYFINDTNPKSDDGRDQWQSRTSYILASMGGAVGFGNLLRFPSQVFNNNGLQWFIPYLLAITFVAIPTLILEVALGSSFRGGPVLAYNVRDQSILDAGMVRDAS